MSVFSSRGAGSSPRVARPRTGLALLVVIGLLVSACGFSAQTLQPYTPAEGVNFDVGDENVPDTVVHVRNLLIISPSSGFGIVSATLSTAIGSDTLVGVIAVPYGSDGTPAAPAQAQVPGGIPVSSEQVQVLTQQPSLVTFTSPGLEPGLAAQVTVRFARAGSYTARVPVYGDSRAPYASISPLPTVAPAATPSS